MSWENTDDVLVQIQKPEGKFPVPIEREVVDGKETGWVNAKVKFWTGPGEGDWTNGHKAKLDGDIVASDTGLDLRCNVGVVPNEHAQAKKGTYIYRLSNFWLFKDGQWQKIPNLRGEDYHADVAENPTPFKEPGGTKPAGSSRQESRAPSRREETTPRREEAPSSEPAPSMVLPPEEFKIRWRAIETLAEDAFFSAAQVVNAGLNRIPKADQMPMEATDFWREVGNMSGRLIMAARGDGNMWPHYLAHAGEVQPRGPERRLEGGSEEQLLEDVPF
jgi:hypothetical protein